MCAVLCCIGPGIFQCADCASTTARLGIDSLSVLQHEQMSQGIGNMHRGSGHAPHPQSPLPSPGGLPRLDSQDSELRQLQSHAHFSGLQPQGVDRQPHQPQGLSNYQRHQIQQAYNALMQHKQQLSAEEALGLGLSQPVSEPAYPLQSVPSQPGPNNMPGNRALPSMTSSNCDTIMKLKEQLSALTNFMQAQRSSEQRPMPGVICSCNFMLARSAVLSGSCRVCVICRWCQGWLVFLNSCTFRSCGAGFCVSVYG